MKKILLAFSIFIGISFSIFYGLNSTAAKVSSEFSNEVFPWMMENGLTKFTDITAFRPSDTITRAEASKFVVSYAELLGLEKGVKSCGFSDTVGFDVSLIPFIQDSCLYGLFRGNNGKFRVNRKNSVLLLVPKSDPKCYKGVQSL